MLRAFVFILLLANGLYFAWSQGLLRDYGFAPSDPSEPQRIAQQVQPQAVRVLTSLEVTRAQDQARAELAPRECLLAGPFDEPQMAALRKALESGFAPEAWKVEEVTLPARWIIYMGKYTNAEMLAKKRAELSSMQLTIEALTNPALEIGLSLGSFPNEAAANQELARLATRGIRTARVVQERAQMQASQVRIAEVTEALKPRLQDLNPVLAGKAFRPCSTAG
jgi:hypothetical protein